MFKFELDYDKTGYSITGFNDSLFAGGELIIPETYKNKPVTVITKNAFKNCLKIEKIVFSKNLCGIGDQAFCGCKNLKEVVFNSNCSFGRAPFYDCKNISFIRISQYCLYSLTDMFGGYHIDKKGFIPAGYINSEYSASIPEKLQTISIYYHGSEYILHEGSIGRLSSLKHVIVEEGVKTIHDFELRNKEVNEIFIPKSVVEFSDNSLEAKKIIFEDESKWLQIDFQKNRTFSERTPDETRIVVFKGTIPGDYFRKEESQLKALFISKVSTTPSHFIKVGSPEYEYIKNSYIQLAKKNGWRTWPYE